MSTSYFKPRDRFDFSKDTLDIGNPVSWKRSTFLKHFFKRVFAISEDHIEVFYSHHLAYYLENHTDGREEIFFKNLWELIDRQLKVLLRKDVYDDKHIQNERQIKQLKKFTDILIALDQWNIHKSNDAVIAGQESEIHTLKQQVVQLKSDLKKATALETPDYINITEDYRDTLLDLMLQVQEIILPDGRELVLSQTQAVWTKMICKYFREADQELNHDTIRRYFPTDKKDPGVKHALIQQKYKLFQIKPAAKRS